MHSLHMAEIELLIWVEMHDANLSEKEEIPQKWLICLKNQKIS